MMTKVILSLGVFVASVMSLMASKVHVVQKNETLGAIAIRYGVSVPPFKRTTEFQSQLPVCRKKLKIPSGNEER